jgi:hypothetical protein
MFFPVPAEQVCEIEGHEGNRWLLDSGQGAEGVAGLGLADLGEVEIDEGGLEGGVAEVGLDGAPAQSFELDETEVVLIPPGGGDVTAR